MAVQNTGTGLVLKFLLFHITNVPYTIPVPGCHFSLGKLSGEFEKLSLCQ